MVYLPTSYLYANKCQMPLSPFVKDLRGEIYVQRFSLINFAEHRSTVAPTDMKRPNSLIVSIMNSVMRAWEAYYKTIMASSSSQQYCAGLNATRRRKHIIH